MSAEPAQLRTRSPSSAERVSRADPPSEELGGALLERARAGDMQAWSRLYQEHFDGLFRHLRYLCGEAALAEELVQETFVQALSAISRFDARSSFSTWLHGIGLNVVRSHWRAQKSTQRAHAKLVLVHQVSASGEAPTEQDESVLKRQRVAALYAALERLPEHLRAAFILRELEGLSLDEAAAQLGITTNNLAVRASRARARIRKLLASEGSVG